MTRFLDDALQGRCKQSRDDGRNQRNTPSTGGVANIGVHATGNVLHCRHKTAIRTSRARPVRFSVRNRVALMRIAELPFLTLCGEKLFGFQALQCVEG